MRVLIADDHALFRDGLRSLLEAHGVTVVAEARNGREAVELARLHRPEVVLMDLSMPELGGLGATRLITAELPEVAVVVLTASEDDAEVHVLRWVAHRPDLYRLPYGGQTEAVQDRAVFLVQVTPDLGAFPVVEHAVVNEHLGEPALEETLRVRAVRCVRVTPGAERELVEGQRLDRRAGTRVLRLAVE